ncbi:MAG: hypothetical protein AAF665_02415 [Pseudomonadota bacterium]
MTVKTYSSTNQAECELTGFEFDDFELGVLAIARYFVLGFQEPGSHAWRYGYSIAAERWGETVGLSVAHGIQKIVRAAIEVRPANIKFRNPFCATSRLLATQDEMVFLKVVHYMRRDQTPQARHQVDVFTHGSMDPHFIRAGLSFAARFSSGSKPQQQSFAQPRLAVVK